MRTWLNALEKIAVEFREIVLLADVEESLTRRLRNVEKSRWERLCQIESRRKLLRQELAK